MGKREDLRLIHRNQFTSEYSLRDALIYSRLLRHRDAHYSLSEADCPRAHLQGRALADTNVLRVHTPDEAQADSSALRRDLLVLIRVCHVFLLSPHRRTLRGVVRVPDPGSVVNRENRQLWLY